MHRDSSPDTARRTGEDGQTMAEYAMVIAVITVAILLTIQLVGDTAGGIIDQVAEFLD